MTGYTVLATKNFPTELREELEPILANGAFHHGDNLEQMGSKNKAGRIFSIRLNQKSRVMLARIMINGKPAWLLLELLENHDYQDSQALKKGWLAAYLKKHGLSLEREHRESLEETVSLGDNDVVDIEYHNEHWLVLSDEQKPQYINFPLIVSGMPGTGKSVTALSLMKTEVGGNDNRPVLYVTKSSFLTSRMQENIDAMPELNGQTQVLDYATLMRQLGRKNADENEVQPENSSSSVKKVEPAEHCTNWLKKNLQGLDYKKLGFASAAQLHLMMYREFRIISGCANFQAYRHLGTRQAFFAEEQRGVIYQAYTNYLKSEKGARDLSLKRAVPPLNAQYKAVFVDESQDFSDAELLDLHDLAGGRIVYFMDSNQSLMDMHSKRDALKRHLGRDIATIVLPYSFRCSQAVVKAANALLKIRLQVTGGALEKNAEIEVKNDAKAQAGQAIWIEHQQHDALSNQWIKAIQDGPKSTQRIVVTWPEHFEAARKLFPGATIATPEDVKGLEYDEVIAFHLLDEAHFAELNPLLSDEYIEKTSRAKAEFDRRELGPGLNQVFTAFTRACKNLYVIDDSSCHKTRKLTNLVKKAFTYDAIRSNLAESSIEEWRKQVKQYIKEGRFSLAKQISDQNLGAGVYESMIESSSSSSSSTSSSATSSTSSTKVESRPVAQTANAKAKSAKKTEPVKTSPVLLPSNQVSPKVRTRPPQVNLSSSSAEDKEFQFLELRKACTSGDLELVKQAIRRGADFRKTYMGFFPIHHAITCGHLNIVEYLFKLDPKLNLRREGVHPIHVAAKEGKLRMVELLHRLGVPLTTVGEKGCTVINYAITNDHLEILAYCHANGVDLNGSMTGATHFEQAIALKATKACRFFLENGVDVKKNPYAIHQALASKWFHLATLLISKGFDVHSLHPVHGSTLSIAVAQRHLDWIRTLHSKGVDINQKDGEGNTPLHLALIHNFYDVAELLIQLGADVNTKNGKNRPILSNAIFLKRYDFADLLLQKGAVVTQLDNENGTALYVAAQNGNLRMVRALCEKGAKLEVKFHGVITPFSVASSYAHFDVMIYLQQQGADINAPALEGVSPAMTAAQRGSTDILKFLVKKGADLNKPNSHGARPVHVANDIDILRLLKQPGVNFDAMTPSGLRPTLGAVYLNDLPRLKVLIEECGANPDLGDLNGVTPLVLAVILGKKDITEYLMLKQHNNEEALSCLVPIHNTSSFLKTENASPIVLKRLASLIKSKESTLPKFNVTYFRSAEHVRLTLNEIVWALGHEHMFDILPNEDSLMAHFM